MKTMIMTLGLVAMLAGAAPTTEARTETNSIDFYVCNTTDMTISVYMNETFVASVSPGGTKTLWIRPGKYTLKAVATNGKSVTQTHQLDRSGLRWRVFIRKN